MLLREVWKADNKPHRIFEMHLFYSNDDYGVWDGEFFFLNKYGAVVKKDNPEVSEYEARKLIKKYLTMLRTYTPSRGELIPGNVDTTPRYFQ
jgi:hypothetical protein